MNFHKEIENIFDQIVAWRRHLHANPELSFEEKNTSAFICDLLDKWGVSYSREYGGYSIVASLKGREGEKCIALRADMDALPIQEENTCEYKSKVSGCMHACGHDVHTANLLGVLAILKDHTDLFGGTIKFIFQHAEEKLPGGASIMIEKGVLQNPKVEEIYGLHVFPDLEVGKVGFRSGMYMASCDELYFRIIGKGGHGAMPHKTIDPIQISAQIIQALQTVNSRSFDPTIPSVISIGRIEGLGATNVIPDEVKMQGTFRTLNEEWRAKGHELITEIAKGIAKANGAQCEVEIIKGYPYLENDQELTESAMAAARNTLGEERVIDLPIRMTGEDFAYYSQKIPACFFRLGVRNEEKGIIHGVHNSKFDVDEACFKTGVQTMLGIVLDRMS
ncbi:MAG: amidohydrolase [Crocinitomicaceae bacterium]|nr:amidohydrolase [Crocinitomicaceae bacterium]